jgi:outer membrane protein OmpA-like peptidoglycan-associated protein|tara:strand:+ start:514 stop:1398 length:885 start_codon:yes stop_codon:yes gene_type:complete
MASPLLQASEATSDVPGSQDFDLVKRYPRSHIIQYERPQGDLPYRLILGPLKKVNNILSPKKSQQVEGRLTSITYRIPDGSRSEEVSAYFMRMATESKGAVIFRCQGRECGSSNYWANTIFKRSVLYGPEQFQNFFVSRFIVGDTTTVASIYTARRGNKRLYAHIDIIETRQSNVETDPQRLLDRLLDRGVYLLSGVDFDAEHRLTPQSAAAIAVAAAAISMHAPAKVYVVGHLQGTDALQSLVDNSRHRADQVASLLIERGVDPGRISAHGVGPFAPLGGSSEARIELVLAPE